MTTERPLWFISNDIVVECDKICGAISRFGDVAATEIASITENPLTTEYLKTIIRQATANILPGMCEKPSKITISASPASRDTSTYSILLFTHNDKDHCYRIKILNEYRAMVELLERQPHELLISSTNPGSSWIQCNDY